MKYSVLIVDDNPETRSLLRLMLRPIAKQVWEANNGHEALSQAHQHHPDLIILDFMMPDMDGTEVSNRLREDATTANIPILLLTARPDSKVIDQGELSGITHFLFKPISRQQLLDAIQEAVTTISTPSSS